MPVAAQHCDIAFRTAPDGVNVSLFFQTHIVGELLYLFCGCTQRSCYFLFWQDCPVSPDEGVFRRRKPLCCKWLTLAYCWETEMFLGVCYPVQYEKENQTVKMFHCSFFGVITGISLRCHASMPPFRLVTW